MQKLPALLWQKNITDIDRKTRDRLVMECTFYNQPFMNFMILILEDRAVYNIEKVLQKIKKSGLMQNPLIKNLCNRLIQNKTNPAKMGTIGQYIYNRSKMFSEDELCALADVCETYDSVVRIQDRIIRKITRERIKEMADISDEHIQIVADLVMCIVCTDMVEVYYSNYERKGDFVRSTYKGMEKNAKPFAIATMYLDNIVFEIIGKKFSFDMWERFDRAYRIYTNTIINSDRIIKHYNDLHIDDYVNIKSNDPTLRIYVQYKNNKP